MPESEVLNSVCIHFDEGEEREEREEGKEGKEGSRERGRERKMK